MSSSQSPPPPKDSSLLSMLQQLPPSAEVVSFYRAKVRQFEAEEQQWLQRLASSSRLLADNLELEKAVQAGRDEVASLQKAVVDMQSALAAERKRAAKLQAENDKLRIRSYEDHRKVLILLEFCGKTDNDLNRLLTEAKQSSGQSQSDDNDVFVPERVKRFLKMTRQKQLSQHRHASKKSAECLRLEVAALESQLLDQEQCHVDQVSTMENERRVAQRERDALRQQFKHRFEELSRHVNELESRHVDLHEDLSKSRSQFRKSERTWLTEKETLLRKIQFLQHYGPVASVSAAEMAGFHTSQRSAVRLGGDQRLQKQIAKLNSELGEQKTTAESYRAQVLSMEAEMDSLREHSTANREVLKKRTRKMVEQVETLKDRYEQLESRKRLEAEGYRADVRLLQQKVRQVETQLVAAALAKSKEHDYIKTITSMEKEIDELRKLLKKNPEWRS